MTFFEDKKAGALLPSDIAQYQAWRKAQKVRKHHKEEQIVCEQNISNAAVNREIGVLKRCFNLAIREQLLDKNACVGVKPLKGTERNRICSPEEYETLRSELDGDARDIVVLAFHTGMRYAEIVKLDWSRIHLKERLICLRAEDTKNGEARKVPFRS
jgi:integrase